MRDQHREEPYFARTPQPFGDGPPDPLVYDASPRALRQRTANFVAKRLVDMRYVSGLDRATAERHFRWRPAVAPGGLGFRAALAGQAELATAHRRGDIVIDMEDADRRVTVRWDDAGFGEPVVGAAIARDGYGGIVLGPHTKLQFDRQPVARREPDSERAWPPVSDLPPDATWASGASDQRIFILRRHRLTVAVSNETDHPMDLAALNRVIAAAIATWA
jgi:hypothetical protein